MENTLTVIIPVYNGMPFLPEAVDSVLKQTYTDFRLLIVDDGSTDSSAAYLDSLSDSRIEVRHHSNMGESATCNQAVQSVESDFVAFLHQDDIAVPHRLQKQMDFLVSHLDYACVMSNALVFSGTRSFPNHWNPASQEILDYDSRVHGVILPSTYIFRRDRWLEIGGYRPFLKIGGDYDFLLRCEEVFKMAVVREPLIRYRYHANSATTKASMVHCLAKAMYVQTLAAQRRAGKPEFTFEEFEEREERVPFMSRWRRNLFAQRLSRSRSAVIFLGEGRLLAGWWNRLVAALLGPTHTLGRLVMLFKGTKIR